ncbi:hypothetical protein [Acinetobacter sp.]|uniref:hypothetical protein n=1 Tax=Acinetobacter sp. TaxID=472 RepID=UPI00258D778D|nr:hypothetical protein [Acinetobacter sp.]
MNENILLLKECGRGEFSKENNLIRYDRTNSKLIDRRCVKDSEKSRAEFQATTGFFYHFLDWNKNIRYAALFLENDQLIFNFEKQEYIIKTVRTTRFLLWKKIIINNLTLKVYSPIKTIFIVTDMFPEDVEPIYGRFSNLLSTSQIQEFIAFLKTRNVRVS